MGFCSSSIERIRDEWSSEYRVILQYLPQVTVYICFGDWDGLWVWIRRIGQPKGWSMVSNLALQGQTSCLCSMLFMKLLFTFIGFIILTFLNKGKLQFLAVFSLKIFFFFFGWIWSSIVISVMQMVQNQGYHEMGGGWRLLSWNSSTSCSVWRWHIFLISWSISG